MKTFIQNRKGQKMAVIVEENPESKGLAFVAHGLGGYKEQSHVMAMADTLFSNGYTVVNFDATNSIGESEGKYENATMQNHYEDLVDVISWAKKQNWYQEPFVLAGHSLGGYAVARYAEAYPDEVKAVFPFALVVSGELSYEAEKMLDPEKMRLWKETGWQERESTSKPGTKLRLPWSHMQERLKHDLRPNASKLTMPVLFIVGENDKACLVGSQEALYNLVPGPKAIHIVPGAPHTFKDSKHLEELKNIFDKWIKKFN